MKRLLLGLLIASIALVSGSAAQPISPAQASYTVGQNLPVAASPALAPERASVPIGNYLEQVEEVAAAVEANGRIHILWTGVLNPYFGTFAFYSTSTDNGVNWTPYQVLNYWGAYSPQIVVDDVHQRVHLMYASNSNGIVHHTITGGVVSAPSVLATGWVHTPRLAVDPVSGYAYAVWQQGYLFPLDVGDTSQYQSLTWYAYWKGAGWSSPIRKVSDADTCQSSVAAASGGGVMLAWFQRCVQSLGGATDPGDPNVPRSAYGDGAPYLFPLRQAVSNFYPTPEKDVSILLTYSSSDDKFYLVADHLVYPTHSRVYRYTWQSGVWSAPLDIVQNTSNVAYPIYIGAASDLAKVIYVYNYTSGLQMRAETNGVLGASQTLTSYLSVRGFSGNPLGYFTDHAGNLHMAVTGTKDGVNGFYYVAP